MVESALPDFRFNSDYFKLDAGHRMHYVDEGEGEPVLMLHGNPTWSYYYRNLIDHFKDRYRMVAPDHIGSGLSDKPDHNLYRLKDHIDRLERFVLDLDLKSIHLVVHDWGGAIGFGLAVRHPERIKNIVISNSAAFWSRDVPKRIAILRFPMLGEWAMRRLNGFALPATVMASARSLSRQTKKGLLHPYSSYEDRIGVARFVQDIPFTKKHPTFKTLSEIEALLPNLHCPKQIIWGMQDFCFHGRFLQKWKEIYPDAQVRTLNDAGHYLLEDSPQEFIHTMECFFKKFG